MELTTENQIVRDCGDYEIVVEKRNSHYLSFRVYKVIAKTDNGGRVYNRDGYTSSPDPVESREQAQVFIEGSIKWDGCSDWNIEDGPMHFCGRDSADEFAALLAFIYDLAAELIPSYEGG